jgi:DNA/RNA-binding domain of Phe-tRNA-synthetase-like protein
MKVFQYDNGILARYPTIVGGVIIAQGMTNGPTPKELQAAFREEQQATLQRIGGTPLSQIPSLSAWRAVFRSFGVDPTQYRSAAEALLRRLTKKGDIPCINLLVDLGNLVSIRYALPVAVFDTGILNGAVTVHFADGSERYTTLGQDELEHPEPGEVVFSDDTKLVIARRWCWRQSDQSAAQQETTEALITVEAHHTQAKEDVDAALDDLLTLLRAYAGGNFIFSRLDATNPVITDDKF